MRSANPVLSRQDAFSRGGYNEAPMTVDDVVTKTSVALGGVVIAAAAVFFLMPLQLVFPVSIVSMLAAMVTSFIVARRRRVSPVLTLVFAALEGVFVGAASKASELYVPGVVGQAVFATFIAAAGTLAAYKFFNIKVGGRFRKVVTIATMSYAAFVLINLALSLFGIHTGLFGGGLLGLGISLIAVTLAVLNLVMDFDFIENSINAGAPASESWKAALGLTATLVWMYVEMLRLLTNLSRN